MIRKFNSFIVILVFLLLTLAGCGHKHEYTEKVVEPTCTEKGYTKFTCECGDTYNENEVESLGHSYGEWVVVKEATETEKGSKERTCSACNDKQTEEIPVLAHTHKYSEKVVEPTCTEKGYTEYTCECGDTYKDKETTGSHKEEVVPGKEATCTEEGLTEGKKCSVCNEVLVEQTTISSKGHSYGEWVVVKESTETEKGSKEKTCSACNDKQTEEIPVLAHTHKYSEKVVEPTCTEKGYTEYTCECGDTYKDKETTGSHKEEVVPGKEATCTEEGLTEGKKCSVCNEVLVEQTTISSKGHSYGEWVVVKESTETEKGSKEKTCSACNDKQTEEIPVLAHTHKYSEKVVEPTCIEKGYTEYTCECGDTYKDNYKEITSHKYSDYKIVKNPTTTEDGLKERSCIVCDNKETVSIPKLQNVEVNVKLDLNGGILKDEEAIGNQTILKKFTVTKFLAYDINGYEASINNAHPAKYWYYIAISASETTGYYEIKEIVYLNSNVTANYDYVIMWHSALKDEQLKSELMDIYQNSNKFIGKKVKLDNIPFGTGNANVTVNILDEKTNESIINDIYKESRKFPEVYKVGYKLKGWLCSLDNKIYQSYPGYISDPGNITYTALWVADESSNNTKIEETYTEIVSQFNKIGEINENINLITKDNIRGTTISYESNNTTVLSNTGVFTRPYKETTVSYKITISYQNEVKQYTYEFDVAGYKKLENIASSYIYTNYNSVTNEFFDTMDIIYCAFVLIDVNGGFTGVNGSGQAINSTNTKYLNYMKNIIIPQAHKRGDWVVASIGGGGAAYDLAYEQICDDDNKLNSLVDNIIKLINDYGFDGVDIDWEVPDDGAKFTKLMKKLYTAVKANNKNHLVTAAIGGGKWQPPKYDLKNSKQYLDYINLMTYGMVSNTGYHHSALYKSSKYFDSESKVGHTLVSCSVEESLKIYKDSFDINPSQLIIGGAFYGMKQTRTKTSTGFTEWKSAGSVSYTNIKNSYMNNNNYECFYDTNSQAAYILSKDKLTFISYDNIKSMKAKCEYSLKVGAAGIMYWQNGHDTTGDLINAIKEGLGK